VLADHPLGLPRLGASVVGLAVALAAGFSARASHPPAAATVLLVTLGGFASSLVTARAFFVGLAIVLVVGELLRQARLRAVIPASGDPQESRHPERLGPSADD
jgi:CBS-domain-containing membrane protein